ncbi:MAG: hypothetical protein Q9221_002151 [Calogaya cf. arnoldii]
MQFSTFSIAAALPFLISASPAERRSASAKKLTQRGLFDVDKTPLGCKFSGKIGNGYIENPTGDGKSCFGYPNGGAITCGGPYEQKEIDDIRKAVADQVTKDGQFKSSEAGEWTAYFQDFTWAYDDRDTSAFDETLDSINVKDNTAAGHLEYYWERNGNKLSVSRSGCPGGLFDKN